MKRFLAAALVSVAAALAAAVAPLPQADAYSTQDQPVGVYYTVDTATGAEYEYELLADGTAEITYFYDYGTVDALTVPKTLDGYKVTSIGEYAFCSKNFSSVTIPGSVKTVGSYAFSECGNLKTLRIFNGVATISDHAFTGCTALESVNLGSVSVIGESAFQNCPSLTGIRISKSVTSIGEYAFGFTDEWTYDYYYDEELEDWVDVSGYVPQEGFTIYGVAETEAESYAERSGIDFVEANIINLSECKITLSASGFVYNSTAAAPGVTVKFGTTKLEKGVDFDVEYYDNVNAGTATVCIIGLNDITGCAVKTFTIKKADFTSADLKVTIPYASYTYRGRGIKPSVTVKYAGVKLTTDDYDVSFSNNTNVGTAYITVTAKGSNTKGSFTRTFTVKKLNLSDTNVKVTIPYASYTYRGRGIKPSVTVKYNSDKLTTADYDIKYTNNTNVGTAYITVTAKGSNVTGTYKRTFKVKKLALNTDTHLKVTIPYAKYSCTGSAIKPAVTVKYSSDKLTTSDYTVTYSNNVKVGVATIKVTAKGNNTSGTYTRTFIVKPGKTTISIATTGTKVKISWNKNTDADGYQVWWCGGCDDHVHFCTGQDDFICWKEIEMTKLVTKTGINTTSYTKSGLTNTTVYHFKVRAYKVVNGETYYGDYSAMKNSVAAESRLNGATVGASKNTYKIANYQTEGVADTTVTLTAEETQILADFAKTHFKAGWTPAQKAIYTANWIHENFTYLWGSDYAAAQSKCSSFVKRCFYYKSGECCDYNGGFVAMMNYLGFDARLIKGYRNSSSQHFWGEMNIGGYTYLLEVGDKQYDSSQWYKWAFLCQRYFEVSENSIGDLRYGVPLKNLDI